jgi:hypothetical protein
MEADESMVLGAVTKHLSVKAQNSICVLHCRKLLRVSEIVVRCLLKAGNRMNHWTCQNVHH